MTDTPQPKRGRGRPKGSTKPKKPPFNWLDLAPDDERARHGLPPHTEEAT